MAHRKKRSRQRPQARLVRIAKLVEGGHLEEARSALVKVLERDFDDASALELGVVIAERLQDFGRMLELVDGALEHQPTGARLVARARALTGLGRYDEAHAALDRSLALDADQPSLYEARAAIHLAQDDADAALDAAGGAMALEPNRVSARAAVAASLAALGRPDEAIESYRDSVRATHGDRHARRAALGALESLLREQGETEEADQVAQLTRALG